MLQPACCHRQEMTFECDAKGIGLIDWRWEVLTKTFATHQHWHNESVWIHDMLSLSEFLQIQGAKQAFWSESLKQKKTSLVNKRGSSWKATSLVPVVSAMVCSPPPPASSQSIVIISCTYLSNWPYPRILFDQMIIGKWIMWTKHMNPCIFLFYLQRTTHIGPYWTDVNNICCSETTSAIFSPRRRWNVWIMGCEGEELVLWSLFSAWVKTYKRRPRLEGFRRHKMSEHFSGGIRYTSP